MLSDIWYPARSLTTGRSSPGFNEVALEVFLFLLGTIGRKVCRDSVRQIFHVALHLDPKKTVLA